MLHVSKPLLKLCNCPSFGAAWKPVLRYSQSTLSSSPDRERLGLHSVVACWQEFLQRFVAFATERAMLGPAEAVAEIRTGKLLVCKFR